MQKDKTIVALGEVLWDCFSDGKRLGGAPFNFAYHVGKLGAKSFLLSAIGSDDNGIEAKTKAEKLGINTTLLQINGYPTGSVIVETDTNGIPEYNISSPAAWDYIELKEGCQDLIKQADVLCFGSLAQRNEVSRSTIQFLIDNASSSSLVVFDINLRQDFYTDGIIIRSLESANILKLNEEELPIVCRSSGISLKDEKKAVEEISNKYNLDLIAYTKGESGSYLYSNGEFSFLRTPKVSISDTVGAGDAFTAAVVVGFTQSHPLTQIHQQAVDLAAFVCTKHGATPHYNLITEYLTHD